MMSDESIDRREFAAKLAAGSVGLAAVGGTAAGADDEPEADGFGPPPLPVLLVEFARGRYPNEKLTPEILERIEVEVRANLYRGRVLAKYPFENSDEPAFAFRAYRAEG